MTHTARSTRPQRSRVPVVAALALAALVAVPIGAGAASADRAPAGTAATAPVVEPVLDGWFSYVLAPGWTVSEQATEFQRFRQDFDRELVTDLRLQLLLELRSDDSDLFVFRETNFLNTNDELPWRAAVAEMYLGDDFRQVGDDTVAGSHGDINRAFFQGERTVMVASSRVGDQLVGVIADMPLEPDTAEVQAIDSILGSLQFDPDVALPPLLNFHGAWAWREDGAGQRLIELDYDLPSDWLEVPGGHPTESSADGTAWIQVIFWDDDGMTVEERIDDVVDAVLTVGDGDAPFVDATAEITVDGFVFTVAAVGGVALAELDPHGADPETAVVNPDGAVGMAAVVIADVGDVDVEVVMLNSTGDPEYALLFSAIIDSFVVRAWDAAGEPLN